MPQLKVRYTEKNPTSIAPLKTKKKSNDKYETERGPSSSNYTLKQKQPQETKQKLKSEHNNDTSVTAAELKMFFKKTNLELTAQNTKLKSALKKKQVIEKNQLPPELLKKFPKSQKLTKLYQIQWFKCTNSTKNASRCLSELKLIGTGSYAKVYSAFDSQLKSKVAVKIFDKRQAVDKFKRNQIQKELDLLVKVDHPNIIQLLKVVEDRIRIYFIMDFCGNMNLKEHVVEMNESGRHFERSEIKGIMKSLFDAVMDLHKNKIYHRDIKLNNILLQNNKGRKKEAMLIDFGLAVHNPELPIYTQCGTLPYMAPEIVKRQSYYPAPADVWALGIVFYELLTGHNPFYGRIQSGHRSMEDEEIKRVIGKGFKISGQKSLSLTKIEKEILKSMLRFKPNSRIKLKALSKIDYFQI